MSKQATVTVPHYVRMFGEDVLLCRAAVRNIKRFVRHTTALGIPEHIAVNGFINVALRKEIERRAAAASAGEVSR